MPLSAARAFALRHALIVPLGFAAAAWAAQAGGVDDEVARALYDASGGGFAGQRWPALELYGHRLAKSALWALWFVLLAAALAAPRLPALAGARRALVTACVAMLLGPLVVVTLKELNAVHCPWDLKAYGGLADAGGGWFVARADAARCFPGGHAAGGFSLVALAFAAGAGGRPRWQAIGCAGALAAGVAFGAVRVVQGAHFVSHNLWSAAIDWSLAALLFAPLQPTRDG